MIFRIAFPALFLAALVSPGGAAAQQWTLDVQGGRIRSALDPSSRGSESLVGGIGYDDRSTAFRISTGFPTRADAIYWGALGGWKRISIERGGLVAGVDLSGNGFLFQSRSSSSSSGGLLDPLPGRTRSRSGHALAGQVTPLVGIESGMFKLHTRAGISHYTSTNDGETRDRTVRLGDVQLTFQPSASVAIAPAVRMFRAENEKASTFAGVSAVMTQGRATAWGNFGQWLAAADTSSSSQSAWGAGASLRLTGRATASVSARRDGFDPLHLNPPQTSWSVGLSLRVGGRPGTTAPPVPAAYEQGLATIRLPASAAPAAPSIAGDFNAWKPAPMSRDGKFWTYTVAAAPGVYNYAFVAPDGTWFVPESVPGRKDDGMGGHVAVLVVR